MIMMMDRHSVYGRTADEGLDKETDGDRDGELCYVEMAQERKDRTRRGEATSRQAKLARSRTCRV